MLLHPIVAPESIQVTSLLAASRRASRLAAKRFDSLYFEEQCVVFEEVSTGIPTLITNQRPRRSELE